MAGKRIMVIGNGGREGALATALLESPGVELVLVTPPNWGVHDPLQGSTRLVQLDVAVTDHAAVLAAAAAQAVDFAVIGPEAPLCVGLADELRAAGLAVLGPGLAAAQLEGSKSFAKDFMRRHGLPTAETAVFTDYAALREYISRHPQPLVLKADGLAAGKGVLICPSTEDALAGAVRIMEQREFGAAGDTVVVEKMLVGREISFTCLVAGTQATLLATSTDYKRLLDGDGGPNTGGMGNICPSPYAPPEVVAEFHRTILEPFMRGLAQDGLDYRGFLFVGVMATTEGLKVLEFNVRLGDPEAEVVLPLYRGDWAQTLYAAAQGELADGLVEQCAGACIAVVLASGNYPYGKSEPAVIQGLERLAARGLLAGDPPPLRVYFSGVARGAAADGEAGAEFLASGGRVLVVSALGRDWSDARRAAYEAVGNIRFDGMQFRSDIGQLS